MNFVQKRSIYRATFDFRAEALDYTFSTHGNRRGGSAPYEQIPLGWKYLKKKSWQMKYVSAGLALAGIVAGARIMAEYSTRTPQARTSGVIFMAIALAAAVVLYVLERLESPPTGLTIIPGKHDIRIIHDRQHQAIVDELLKRRRDALRRKFAAVDFLNPPGAESRKFRWLREEGVISEQEYTEAVAKLVGVQPNDVHGPSPPEQIKLH